MNLFSAYIMGLREIARWDGPIFHEAVCTNGMRYYVSVWRYRRIYWLRTFIYEWEPLQPWQWSTGSSFVWSSMLDMSDSGVSFT